MPRMADPSQQAAAAAAAAYGAAASPSNNNNNAGPPPSSNSGGGDRCAQCHAVGVPLLSPDEPVGMAPVPGSNKPR